MRDEAFLRGQSVPMTKQPVRQLALDYLELAQARHFIDVGAGTGSVALEAALRYPAIRVHAIERNADALALIEENRRRLGCDNVTIIPGVAPQPLDIRADAIFIGGSGGHLPALLHWALEHLLPGGRLVLTFILLDNLTQALDALRLSGVAQLACAQLHYSALTALGDGHYFKPNNPTYLISCRKEGSHVATI